MRESLRGFVRCFRESSPYIHAHRGRKFVLVFGGEAVAAENFSDLIHDLALLHGLGIRLVLVHGARPQIEERLLGLGLRPIYRHGLRVTDEQAMACAKDAAGRVRLEIEARLSMGMANSPMAGARIRTASGNFVTARPIGVHHGVDYQYTGRVRRVDAASINARLDQGEVVLVSPLGYSPTGEVFNLSAAETAAEIAVAIAADKLICLADGHALLDQDGDPLSSISPDYLQQRIQEFSPEEEYRQYLEATLFASRSGIPRSHILSHRVDGALLQELFSREGAGTLVSRETLESIRVASIEDVAGILELIEPLERQQVLVRRSRELLEMEIDRFRVIERDGMLIGCAALYPYPEQEMAELACLVVHRDYQKGGRGDQLLAVVEGQAKQAGLHRLFALTVQTAHWFLERGFENADIGQLPEQKKKFYNLQRNSKVLIKRLAD